MCVWFLVFVLLCGGVETVLAFTCPPVCVCVFFKGVRGGGGWRLGEDGDGWLG